MNKLRYKIVICIDLFQNDFIVNVGLGCVCKER